MYTKQVQRSKNKLLKMTNIKKGKSKKYKLYDYKIEF